MGNIAWQRRDTPVFENGAIKLGEPLLINDTQRDTQTPRREYSFEAREYCRLLHVLIDWRMTTARAQLMEPRT